METHWRAENEDWAALAATAEVNPGVLDEWKALLPDPEDFADVLDPTPEQLQLSQVLKSDAGDEDWATLAAAVRANPGLLEE